MVLGRGVAKCTALDKEILAKHVLVQGRSGGLNLLEADWVATNAALYYVTPRVASVLRWPWEQIVSVVKGRRGLLTAGVDIRFTNGSVMTWKLAGLSALELSEIARGPKAVPHQPPPPSQWSTGDGPPVESLFSPAEWQQIRLLPSALMAMVTYADGVAEEAEVAATIREILVGEEQYASQLAKAMAAAMAQDLLSGTPAPDSSVSVRSAMAMVRSRVGPSEYQAFVIDLADSLWVVASQSRGALLQSQHQRDEFRQGMTAEFLRECGVDPEDWLRASRWAR
jgi:hypothetical protein